MGFWWPFNFFLDERGHGRAQAWYRWTVQPRASDSEAETFEDWGVDGFSLSPLVTGALVPRPWISGGSALAAVPAPPPDAPSQPIHGFSFFGSVAESAGEYTVVEQANAGITKTVTVPTGAYALRFRFQFAAPGDGDFLTVHFGSDHLLYTGSEHELSRRDYTRIETTLTGTEGRTGELTFTLVSRGAANSVLKIMDIEFLVGDDPDGDGLTIVQEQSAGTDPLKGDTDDDGFTDSQELNLFHTSPLTADSDADGQTDAAEIAAGTDPGDGRSVMTVLAFARAGNGVALRWTSVRGKSYRVLRARKPGFASYEVMASGLVASGMQMEFTDPAVLPALVPAMVLAWKWRTRRRQRSWIPMAMG